MSDTTPQPPPERETESPGESAPKAPETAAKGAAPARKPAARKKAEAPAPAYTLSSSPHARRDISIRSIMRDVLLALTPAALCGVYFFGLHALWVLALCVVSCIGLEALIQRFMGTKVTISDGSAAVTGLLVGMTMPPKAEWWLCITGALVAIGLGKHIFGGLGFNPFNPALLARVVLLISFPAQMTAFYSPSFFGLDAVSAATPLSQFHEGRIRGLGIGEAADVSLWSAFFGNIPGSIGETSALALLLGGIFLLLRGHITWDIPVAMLGTVALVSGVCWWIDPVNFVQPTFHLITGGMMLAALFMATDMVTSPLTTKGKLIFGIGCGLITIVIRQWGGYAEAVSFGILLMNAAVPIIDRYTAPRLYGTGRRARRRI